MNPFGLRGIADSQNFSSMPPCFLYSIFNAEFFLRTKRALLQPKNLLGPFVLTCNSKLRSSLRDPLWTTWQHITHNADSPNFSRLPLCCPYFIFCTKKSATHNFAALWIYDSLLEYVATHILQRRQPEIVQLVALLPYLDPYFNSPPTNLGFFRRRHQIGFNFVFWLPFVVYGNNNPQQWCCLGPS